MLEQQQEKLVNALRELYNRMERNERWPGQPLERTNKGFPLTHDILERLGMLNLGPDENEEPFEENTDVLLGKMMNRPEENAYPTPNTMQSGFSPQESEIMDFLQSPPFGSELCMPMDQYPPTPSSRTPEEQVLCHGSSMAVNASAYYAYMQPPVSYPDGLNMCNYSVAQTYDGLGIKQERANPCLPIYRGDLGFT